MATTKGLFELRRHGRDWAIEHVSFFGEPVCIFLPPAAADQQLLMTSTSGGLWAGADAGESWQTVSQSLPPAVAVRFG